MQSDSPQRRKRGRPKSDGTRSGIEFLLTSVALAAYQKSRSEGVKHEAALNDALEAVKLALPDQNCSVTKIKQILAEWMPADAAEQALLVTSTQRISQEPQQSPHSPPQPTVSYGIGFGKRAAYKRINAAKK